MRRRNLVLLAAAIVLTVTTVTVGTAGGQSSPPRTHEPSLVRILGSETFEANALIQATFRFSPERFFPHSGDSVRWSDQDTAEEPHTVTIVRRGQVPSSADEVFNCGPCNRALDAHFASNPPALRVNVGNPGLDRPGDSLLLLPGQSISAAVSAPSGTTLYYVCAIHAWMQGRLVVG
jgi:plastocyanin